MLHKIVAVFALGSVLGLASISTNAMALGGGGVQGSSLAAGGGVRGGSFGFHGRGFGPGFAGHGLGNRGRVFGRGRFVSPVWVGDGWWGGPAFSDDDLCFAWTPSGYRWACGY
jgi:hypothetical protein